MLCLEQVGEAEDEVRELENSSLQEKLDLELKELNEKLDKKEVTHTNLFQLAT